MRPVYFPRVCLVSLLAWTPWLAHAQVDPMAPQGVRKLGDSELSCAQLYTETRALERTLMAQHAEAMQAQEAMTQAQNLMMQQANDLRGGGMGSIGSSLLGMIPGGSQVAGAAMQAAASARRDSMQENANRMVQAQTKLMNLSQALEQTQARNEHLTDLFLKKGCKLSEVRAAAEPAS